MEWNAVMRLFAALEAEGVRYAVVGGVALNLHGLERATADVDLFIEPNVANVEALKRALHRVYVDASIDEITAVDLLGDYPAIRYVPPQGPPLDIVTRLGDAVPYSAVVTEPYDVDGQVVRVATPRTLYEMKRGTIRPQDHADAARLAQAFDLEK